MELWLKGPTDLLDNALVHFRVLSMGERLMLVVLAREMVLVPVLLVVSQSLYIPTMMDRWKSQERSENENMEMG